MLVKKKKKEIDDFIDFFFLSIGGAGNFSSKKSVGNKIYLTENIYYVNMTNFSVGLSKFYLFFSLKVFANYKILFFLFLKNGI